MATQTSSPANQAARDRRNETPADPNRPIIEGVINPSAKAFDPKNPAGAPILQALHEEEEHAEAHAELTLLLRKDTSRMEPEDRLAHDRRVHELHYLANGEEVPARGRRKIVTPATPDPAA